jgi:hypothetical protein
MYTLFATPQYSADALIQIEDKQQNSLLKSLNQLTPGYTPDSMAEIQLLKSRMILGKPSMISVYVIRSFSHDSRFWGPVGPGLPVKNRAR